jgi:hypothetical protein
MSKQQQTNAPKNTQWLIVNHDAREYIEHTSENKNLYVSLFDQGKWKHTHRVYWLATHDPSRFIAQDIREKYKQITH